eukprot:958251-Rhodomonas_salina.2
MVAVWVAMRGPVLPGVLASTVCLAADLCCKRAPFHLSGHHVALEKASTVRDLLCLPVQCGA